MGYVKYDSFERQFKFLSYNLKPPFNFNTHLEKQIPTPIDQNHIYSKLGISVTHRTASIQYAPNKKLTSTHTRRVVMSSLLAICFQLVSPLACLLRSAWVRSCRSASCCCWFARGSMLRSPFTMSLVFPKQISLSVFRILFSISSTIRPMLAMCGDASLTFASPSTFKSSSN